MEVQGITNLQTGELLGWRKVEIPLSSEESKQTLEEDKFKIGKFGEKLMRVKA